MTGGPPAGSTGGAQAGSGDAVARTLASSQVETTLAAPDALASRAPDAPAIARGTVIGRYVVLSELGAGGMGIVYAAYDPELDRKVALKLLLAERGPGTSASIGGTRLLREAQALAKLSHPNIVAIYDVGAFDDRVWLAMEYIDGLTFGAWLKSQPRRWPEVLRTMLTAGHGLFAAHTAGLVHRDLKPDNIMVGSDGRVRVMDFGLARAADPRRPVHEALPTAARKVAALSLSVTQAGAVMGTPAYMAPEQWNGEEADARADQFAYCVTLWEALFGERPFEGDTMTELAGHVVRGERRAQPRGSRVPGWLRRAIGRGLQVEPDRRFTSMQALLTALEHGQVRMRLRRVVLGVGIAVAGTAGAALWMHHDRALRIDACDAAGAEISAVWNPEVAAALHAALLATGVPNASTTHAKVLPWVEQWTRDWSHMRVALCRETLVEGTRPAALDALSTACLEERRDELQARLAVLIDGGAAVVPRAVPAVAGLSPLGPCAEQASLERRPAPPPDSETRVRVAELRREMMRVTGLNAAGRYGDGLERALAALKAAEQLGYAPLTVEARVLVGILAARTGDTARSEEALTQAYVEAGVMGADDVAATAAVQLVGTTGYLAARPAEGLLWSRSAEMLLRRLGLAEQLPGALFLNNLAIVHQTSNSTEQALALHARALEIRERALGPDHPDVASTLNNLAEAHRERGENRQALALHRRALAISQQALGPDHPSVALSQTNLALVHVALGEVDAAQDLYERSLALREQALGKNHPDVANSLSNLAELLRGRKQYDRALALQQRALAIREQTLDPTHPDVAASVEGLADIHQALGEYDEAQALYERALGIRERLLGPDDMRVGYSLLGLGELALLRGRPADALPLLERTTILMRTAVPENRAVVGFALARALWDAGSDRARAKQLATEAAAIYRTNAAQQAALAAVESWLQTHE